MSLLSRATQVAAALLSAAALAGFEKNFDGLGVSLLALAWSCSARFAAKEPRLFGDLERGRRRDDGRACLKLERAGRARTRSCLLLRRFLKERHTLSRSGNTPSRRVTRESALTEP